MTVDPRNPNPTSDLTLTLGLNLDLTPCPQHREMTNGSEALPRILPSQIPTGSSVWDRTPAPLDGTT